MRRCSIRRWSRRRNGSGAAKRLEPRSSWQHPRLPSRHRPSRHGTRIRGAPRHRPTDQDAITVERFESALAAAGEVTELRRLFGKPDYFVRVAVADLPAYETFLSSRVMTIPGVGRVHSRFAMKDVRGAAADL
jgi:DNA-binding Lrp family transcriptional regulator